jgi:hypothetical protein
MSNDIHQNFWWRFEAERMWIANVQLHDAVALLFKALGLYEYGTSNVIQDIRELVRLMDVVRSHD